jgi:hypothetical protein
MLVTVGATAKAGDAATTKPAAAKNSAASAETYRLIRIRDRCMLVPPREDHVAGDRKTLALAHRFD